MVLLLRDNRDDRGWICRVVARSLSARQLPRLRRSHRVLPQCRDSVAMGAIADTADAHSKRRFGAIRRGGRKWRPDSSMPEKASGNDELLNFAGSVENPKSPGMPKQTFDCRTANDAKATKNLYSLINDVEGSFS
jgi:hypothetical protein